MVALAQASCVDPIRWWSVLRGEQACVLSCSIDSGYVTTTDPIMCLCYVQYAVETRKIGEERVPGAETEQLGSETQEVEHRTVPGARGDRNVVVEDVDVPASEVRLPLHLNSIQQHRVVADCRV